MQQLPRDQDRPNMQFNGYLIHVEVITYVNMHAYVPHI